MPQGSLAFSHANLMIGIFFKEIKGDRHLKPAEFLSFCQKGSLGI